MKLRTLLPTLALLSCSSAPEATAPAASAVPAASGDARAPADTGRLYDDVAWLADDAQEGRRAGTEGGRRAGRFLEERFAELGLEPAGEDGSFRQTFEVPLPIRDGGDSSIGYAGPARAAERIAGAAEIVPLFCSDGATASGPLVWGGYGIIDPGHGRDDLADPAVAGGVVLIVRGAPPLPESTEEEGEQDDTALVQHGTGWGNAATLFTKVMNAKRRGAAAVIVAEAPGSEEPMMRFDVSRSAQANIPAVFVSAAAARRMVSAYDALVAASEAGESRGAPILELTVVADVRRERGEAFNVLARLPGRQRGRTVVVGAHYDHLGHGGDGSLAPDLQGEVHNGADDNASGTAVVLELARLMTAAAPPEGDVVFALWSGEELGLLGSEHWAKNATVDLAEITANVNLDMVGRAGDGVLTVLGAGTAEPLGEWIEAAGASAELELRVNRSGQGVGGSDHQTFLKREIPAVHLFSGLHDDYHKPSDDVGAFEAEGAGRVVGLCLELVHRIQSAEALVWVTVEADETNAARPSSGWSVRFGSVPDYAFEGEGLRLSGTSGDSPAEKAGLLQGDVIVQVGEVVVENIYDFMHALQIYKPGDVVLTRYLRDGEEREVRITLAARQ